MLVVAASQTKGRGRTGAGWVTAPRALAVSLAFRHDPADLRPIPLLAGVAVVRTLGADVGLKWPNDVVRDDLKLGGILVERSGESTVVGLGLNLWWPEPPDGAGAVHDDDPGPAAHQEIGSLWGAELMEILDASDWPIEEYRASCVTVGRSITWEPYGSGTAQGIAEDGGLVVATSNGTEVLHSGAVRHVRG